MYTYYLRTIFTYDMKYDNLEILKMWIHSMPQQSFSISRASASTSWHPCSATQGFPWRKALGQPRGLRSFNPLDKTWKHWASRNWIWHDITTNSNLNGKYDRGDGFWTDLLLHIGGRWILGHPSLLTSLWEHQLICSSFSSAFLFFLNQSQYQASIWVPRAPFTKHVQPRTRNRSHPMRQEPIPKNRMKHFHHWQYHIPSVKIGI